MNIVNNILCKITPTFDYHYFANNQLENKTLHIFQYIARKAFGCYANTHLANVVKTGYTVTLVDAQNPNQHQRILNLFDKANRKFGNEFYGELVPCQLSDGSTVSPKVHYSTTQLANGNIAISSIDFKLQFSKMSTVPARYQGQPELLRDTHKISIKKKIVDGNGSLALFVDLPQELYKVELFEAENSINARLNHDRVKFINSFIAKILYDSEVDKVPAIFHYAEEFGGAEEDIFKSDKARLIDDTRKAVLESAGWDSCGISNIVDGRSKRVRGKQCLWRFSNKARNYRDMTALFPNTLTQPLVLNFAAQHIN